MRRAESKPLVVAVIGLVVISGGGVLLSFNNGGPPALANFVAGVPTYTSEGALLLPENYQEWVFVGASTGLSYSEGARSDGLGMFHNVYITPPAYRRFTETGEFPEQTMFALAMYEPSQKDDLVRGGFFEGEFTALEFAVKDSARFDGGWAYFNFSGANGVRPQAQPIQQGCAGCHREHGAVDNDFGQFYPMLRAARQKSH